VHQRLHRTRTAGLGRADVATVAREMVAEGGRLLCFDEFNVRTMPAELRTKPSAAVGWWE